MNRHAWTIAPLLVIALLPGSAAAGTPRTESGPYTVSGVEDVLDGSAGAQGSGQGAASFQTRRKERTISIRLIDDSGNQVFATVKQDQGDGRYVVLGEFCGATRTVLRLKLPGRPVMVAPVVGRCDDGHSIPTQGVVEVSFR